MRNKCCLIFISDKRVTFVESFLFFLARFIERGLVNYDKFIKPGWMYWAKWNRRRLYIILSKLIIKCYMNWHQCREKWPYLLYEGSATPFWKSSSGTKEWKCDGADEHKVRANSKIYSENTSTHLITKENPVMGDNWIQSFATSHLWNRKVIDWKKSLLFVRINRQFGPVFGQVLVLIDLSKCSHNLTIKSPMGRFVLLYDSLIAEWYDNKPTCACTYYRLSYRQATINGHDHYFFSHRRKRNRIYLL